MKKIPEALLAFIIFIFGFDVLSLNLWRWLTKVPYLSFEYCYHVYDTMVSMTFLFVYTAFVWIGYFIEEKNLRASFLIIIWGCWWFSVNDLIQFLFDDPTKYDKWETIFFVAYLITTTYSVIMIYRTTILIKLMRGRVGSHTGKN